MKTTVYDCQMANLPRMVGETGGASPVCARDHLGFEIARIYYLYDVPTEEGRGGHAHKELRQVLVAAAGSFRVLLDDGRESSIVTLSRADSGLYVPSFIWRELFDFSPGGVCLVLASLPYDEADYIRDYEVFLREKRHAG